MNSLTVYCSSSTRLDPDFHEPAKIVGRELAQRGITLVYGGGGIGLMGELARTIHEHHGKIVGIITHTLNDKERGYVQCDEYMVVDTMQQRKHQMMQRGEAFLILPGGVGTYEEFFEVLAARIVGEHTKPIGIVNSHGYFDPLIDMINHGIEHQFIKAAVLHELLHIDPDPVKVLDALAKAERASLDRERFMPMGRK